MTPYPHQIEGAEHAYKILKDFGMVYLAWEERTGKTITSILVAEQSKAQKILVLTKKKALEGWRSTMEAVETTKSFTITNYHQANKLKPVFDLIILDEAHSYLSAYPRTGKIWKDVAKLTKGVPLIFLSATPYAQGYQLLFNQFKLSSWSPWKQYKNFYDWFRIYGIPKQIRTPYGFANDYTNVKPHAWDDVKHLFLTKTRKDLNFEHEPEDIIHWVELDTDTRAIYNQIMKEETMIVPTLQGNVEVICDSPMKLRTTLHMIEGGVLKMEDSYYELPNREKIDSILRDFGDREDVVIMYNYIAEGEKLKRLFRSAKILQGTSWAEGVDLSRYTHLIIYSQDFSTARHSQRRARQANKTRAEPINVHFYLVKGAISEQVYKTVSVNKTNFIDKLFERTMI